MRKNIEDMIIIQAEINQLGINGLVSLIETASMNKKMREKIDNIYNKNKTECYNLAQENYYYDFPLFKNADVQKEEYCKKLLGIHMLASKDEKIMDELIDSYRAVWTIAFNYIEKNKKIRFDKIIEMYLDININRIEQMAVFNVSLFFCKILNKEIVRDEYFQGNYDMIFNEIIKYLEKEDYEFLKRYGMKYKEYDRVKVFKYYNFNDELKKNIKSIKNRITKEYGINLSEIYDYLYFIEDKNVESVLKVLRFIMESEGLDMVSFATKYSFNKKDINEVIGVYNYVYGDLSTEDAMLFIAYGLMLKIFCKSYADLKKLYFKNHKENLCIEIEKSQKQVQSLRTENYDLKKKLNQTSTEISYLRDEYKKGLEREICNLNNSNERLQKEVEELKKDKKELVALRESLFIRDNTGDKVEVSQVSIPSVKAIIFGGNENWQNKLKDELPESFRVESGINEGFDERILDNVQMVFLNVKYMNHGVYYKIMENVRNKDVTIAYINSTNIDLVKKEIANKLKSLKMDALGQAC